MSMRKSIFTFALWGLIGFGFGGAVGGAIWPRIGQTYFGFVVMGAFGGASLGLALKNRRRSFISGLTGAIGFGIGSYFPLLSVLLIGLTGVSLGLSFPDWKRAGLLVLFGFIGFLFVMVGTLTLVNGETLWSAITLALWGIVGGGASGATLGYMEKTKADRQGLEQHGPHGL